MLDARSAVATQSVAGNLIADNLISGSILDNDIRREIDGATSKATRSYLARSEHRESFWRHGAAGLVYPDEAAALFSARICLDLLRSTCQSCHRGEA